MLKAFCSDHHTHSAVTRPDGHAYLNNNVMRQSRVTKSLQASGVTLIELIWFTELRRTCYQEKSANKCEILAGLSFAK